MMTKKQQKQLQRILKQSMIDTAVDIDKQFKRDGVKLPPDAQEMLNRLKGKDEKRVCDSLQ